MKAITIHRPWTDAIAYFPEAVAKRIENRSWKPPSSVLGTRIAIHAGKRYDRLAADSIREVLADLESAWHVPGADDSPTGIVATARLAGWVIRNATIGWVLEDVVSFPATPCSGRQGLWDLPAAVEREVELREAAVRTRALDPRPFYQRLEERRGEMLRLSELAFTARAMREGYRRWTPSVESLARHEVTNEMDRERRRLEAL